MSEARGEFTMCRNVLRRPQALSGAEPGGRGPGFPSRFTYLRRGRIRSLAVSYRMGGETRNCPASIKFSQAVIKRGQASEPKYN